MDELFIVLFFDDGDIRYLYYKYPSQADNWVKKYKPNVSYVMQCYDSEEAYYDEMEFDYE